MVTWRVDLALTRARVTTRQVEARNAAHAFDLAVHHAGVTLDEVTDGRVAQTERPLSLCPDCEGVGSRRTDTGWVDCPACEGTKFRHIPPTTEE